MRVKLLIVELAIVGALAGGAYAWTHRPLGPPASTSEALKESRQENDQTSYRPVTKLPPPQITEPTIRQPPKVTVAPIPTHRKTIRRRIGPRMTGPAGDRVGPAPRVPDYVTHPERTYPPLMDIRPPRARVKVPQRIPCNRIPAIARQFDRDTIVRAMQSRGLTAGQQQQVLACLGK